MKHFTIRAFVIALALTGAAATAHSKTTSSATVTSNSAVPVPMCPPHDPNACGID